MRAACFTIWSQRASLSWFRPAEGAGTAGSFCSATETTFLYSASAVIGAERALAERDLQIVCATTIARERKCHVRFITLYLSIGTFRRPFVGATGVDHSGREKPGQIRRYETWLLSVHAFDSTAPVGAAF